MASKETLAPELEKTAPPLETPVLEHEKTAEATAVEVEKEAPPPKKEAPPPEVAAPAGAWSCTNYFVVADVVLRFLLFASALVAVVVMVTSNQKAFVPITFPPFRAKITAKFNHSPAFIYFVAAFSVVGLYSIITTVFSFLALIKPGSSEKLIAHFVIFDVLMLGIAASAVGAAGAVGYLGLKGNSHAGWNKLCHTYDTYCQHLAGSLAVALFGSVVLVLLVLLSLHSLSKKIPK